MRWWLSLLSVLVFAGSARSQQAPLVPFTPDEHTLLLYHFDEGEGKAARDAGKYGSDGEIRGAVWANGKFGRALRFDGKDDSVFREVTEAIEGLRQITVECWFKQDNPSGRQFLIGKDVTFHYDLTEGQHTSMSLYNGGGGAANADGLRHQHLGTPVAIPSRGWHHNAVCYDGRYLSFFFDGVLRHRVAAARDFLLGTRGRGLWVGCYVGNDYWYSGLIDEVRISDCIRYDPESKLKPGGRVFEMPGRAARAPRAVRTPKQTGRAKLELTLRKLYGKDAAGWVSLKAPGRPAVVVGQYALKEMADGAVATLAFDVSDEAVAGGCYLAALDATDASGYFAVTGATLSRGGAPVARWSGSARSRRTFQPPVLVPLQVGAAAPATAQRIILLPKETDRMWGELDVAEEDGAPACLTGTGYAEYWVQVPARTTYRIYLKYATAGVRPCDLVIDGTDLNAYNMCARNRTFTAQARDAFWEYQGTTTLAAGPHWIRIQDVLPDLFGLRLEPVAQGNPSGSTHNRGRRGGQRTTPSADPPRSSESSAVSSSTPRLPGVPWNRYPVPEDGVLGQASAWDAQTLHGSPAGAKAALGHEGDRPALRFAVSFPPSAEAAVRLAYRGRFDLEPFGRLRFRFQGSGSGHVAALRAVDVKGDEKLLWRARDSEAGTQEVGIPLSFEGNDVFDPGHVTALCLDLDEGNVASATESRFEGALIDPILDRRERLTAPEGYTEMLAKARDALAGVLKRLAARAAPLRAPAFRPWTKPVVPEEHPLYATTEPKPVTRQTLGDGLHATGARGIGANTLDDFHKHYDFGDVCWPHIGICPLRSKYGTEDEYQQALKEMEQQLVGVRERGLYLFDIWGYVPDNAGFPWKVSPEHDAILRRVFGDRFLGYDNGEQDGRYIGAYAAQGKATNRREGWDDFVRWDQRICGDAMNYMNATGSLNFSHYYGKRGARMLGLETAQGLPSDTLMFAFLRGAGKQYGRLTYQATSVWNRYGYNMYHERKTDGAQGYGFGPNKGCSRSLHKRLFFAGYLGGQSIFGTETAQFTGDRLEGGAPELSPLGRQHLEMVAWARKHPDRGIQYTPVAFMLDFHNGWNMPRHLYRGDRYKIWGKFPYEKGDYLIDNVFRLVWPGYEDCSYLRNERGFLTPTPYGDLFDVLTNRCHPSVLKQYPAVMLLGEVEMAPQVVKNLTEYVQGGGDLLLDARNARALPETLTGLRFGAEAKGCASYLLSTGARFDEQPYTYTVVTSAGATPLLVNEAGHPLVTQNRAGKGRVIVGAVDHWMTDALTYQVPEIVNMEPPYRILSGMRALLDGYFGSFLPVELSPGGLAIQVCCYDKDPKRLLVGLLNNDLFADWQGTLKVRTGAVASAKELWHGKALTPGPAMPLSIAAGDVAVVEVRLK